MVAVQLQSRRPLPPALYLQVVYSGVGLGGFGFGLGLGGVRCDGGLRWDRPSVVEVGLGQVGWVGAASGGTRQGGVGWDGKGWEGAW